MRDDTGVGGVFVRTRITNGPWLRGRILSSLRWPASVALVVMAAALGLASIPVGGGDRPHDMTPRVVEVRVAETVDDAEESASGRVTRHSSDLEFVVDGSDQVVGIRFVGVEVPAGVTITRAFVQFQTDEENTEETSLVVRGEAADDAGGFTSRRFGISARPTTETAVAWSPVAWETKGEAGVDQRTPDLSGVVQEVVDRSGWELGNALVFIVSGSGHRTAESYNGDAEAAPLLHIEYRRNLVVTGFGVVPAKVAPGQAVTFSWSAAALNGDPVSCTLDVDDDAVAEYVIADCAGTTDQSHVYSTAGRYTAFLTATDGMGQVRATTAVMVSDPRTVVVAAAGDISCDPTSDHFNDGLGDSSGCHMLATSDLVMDMDPDAVLVLGDVQYEDGSLDQFTGSYDLSWGRFKDITYPAVGNHEYKTPDAAGYFEYFGAAAGDPDKGYYSFDVGNWHVVSLNSNCSKAGGCDAGSEQEQWLRSDLAANPAACTLAIWHHPLFSSGSHGDQPRTRDLWVALQETGAELVLTGHDHLYERFGLQDADGNADPSGMRQFVIGTGGRNHTGVNDVRPNSELRETQTYGVLRLALRPAGYDWEFVPEVGSSFTDRGSGECN